MKTPDGSPYVQGRDPSGELETWVDVECLVRDEVTGWLLTLAGDHVLYCFADICLEQEGKRKRLRVVERVRRQKP